MMVVSFAAWFFFRPGRSCPDWRWPISARPWSTGQIRRSDRTVEKRREKNRTPERLALRCPVACRRTVLFVAGCRTMTLVGLLPNSERTQQDRTDEHEGCEHRQHIQLQGKVHVTCLPRS